MARLVVIGGVAAGLSAASRARRLDRSLEILVLEKGSTISYGACGLPYYIEGRVESAGQLIVYTPEYFRRERNIEVRTNAEVAAISHSRREVGLASGERIKYDRLVVATGARPDRTAITGADAAHVFTLYTLDDAERLRSFLQERGPKRAAVIGAGYIGLQAADALRANGLAVTLFASENDLLGRQDAELTKLIARHLERFHVGLRLNTPVRSVDGPGFDVVVLSPGLKPNVELAQEAGIEIGRTGAIRTGDRMETNLSGVFAAGDCVETTHLVTGRPVWIPLGTTANKTGRVAGASAAGARERFPGIVGTSIVRVCGMAVGMTGFSTAQARKEGFDAIAARIQTLDRARYFRWWVKPTTVELVVDRRTRWLLGATVTGFGDGVAGRINVTAAALAAKMTVEDFEHLDLCYAPPFAPVWDPLLVAAQQLRKII